MPKRPIAIANSWTFNTPTTSLPSRSASDCDEVSMSNMGFDDWGLIVTAGLVVVGVLLEGAEHIHDWNTKGWRPIVPKIGFAILVIGLGGEILFETRLTSEAANTRLEAAQIERDVAWRRLTGNQQRALAIATKPFAGESVNFLTWMGDLEAWTFADQIEVSLGYKKLADWTAGWDVHFGRIMWSPRTASGVIIEVSPTANEHDRNAANALANGLASQNIAVVGPIQRLKELQGETVEGGLSPTAPITVTVGVHPAPQ